jgi:hypothetical protein
MNLRLRPTVIITAVLFVMAVAGVTVILPMRTANGFVNFGEMAFASVFGTDNYRAFAGGSDTIAGSVFGLAGIVPGNPCLDQRSASAESC